jgi:hypothetical protein
VKERAKEAIDFGKVDNEDVSEGVIVLDYEKRPSEGNTSYDLLFRI